MIETIDDRTADVLRQCGPAERLEMAFGMWRSAREIITSILVAEAGIEEWGESWPAEDESLVDPSAGKAVRWTPDGGWREESE